MGLYQNDGGGGAQFITELTREILPASKTEKRKNLNPEAGMSVEDNYGRADTKDIFLNLSWQKSHTVIATTWTVCLEIMQFNGTLHTLLLAKSALIIW